MARRIRPLALGTVALIALWLSVAPAGDYQSRPADRNVLDGAATISQAPTALDPQLSTPAAAGRYDVLPLQLREVGEDMRSAMAAEKEYDSLPLSEKARVYALRFSAVYGRSPRFSPAMMDEIAQSRVAFENRRYLYKQPAAPSPAGRSVDISAIPGPWSSATGDIAQGPLQPEYATTADGHVDTALDGRMESLRGGWNARAMLSGGR
ncbi:MAG: hypothetical protein LIP77_02935 [Planctomycetes bacterium]|nr:hypothetical protein [Planctomycetota bacterium]